MAAVTAATASSPPAALTSPYGGGSIDSDTAMDEDPLRAGIVAREIGVERELEPARGDLPLQRGRRPEDHGKAVLVQAGLPQRLERDLRADARRIAHA